MVIEPDEKHPPNLNIFATDPETVRSVLFHAFSSLMPDAELSGPMQNLLHHCISLCLNIPDADIETLADILTSPKGLPGFQPYIRTLNSISQRLFKAPIRRSQHQTHPEQPLAGRISHLLNVEFVSRCSAPRSCDMDFLEEISDTAADHHQYQRSRIGRSVRIVRPAVYISHSLRRPRKSQSIQNRSPVWVYVDEAQLYLSKEERIATYRHRPGTKASSRMDVCGSTA